MIGNASQWTEILKQAEADPDVSDDTEPINVDCKVELSHWKSLMLCSKAMPKRLILEIRWRKMAHATTDEEQAAIIKTIPSLGGLGYNRKKSCR